MKDLGIGAVLVELRRAKGVTQDDLARYIGVSKASVSKWETGQSYPDITFLPLLASYFSITIDALMRYEPQLSAADIRALTHRLSRDFTRLPFEAVYDECLTITKKYYSCHTLLYALGALLLNHGVLSTADRQLEVLTECRSLFKRVREQSDQPQLIMRATEMEAACLIGLNEPERVLELLAEDIHVHESPAVLIAAAQQSLHRTDEAVSTLQAGIYRGLIALIDMLNTLLAIHLEDAQRFDAIAGRLRTIAATFELSRLHPAMALNIRAIFAIGYAKQGREAEALEALSEYWTFAKAAIPAMRLGGDDFFDRIDRLFSEEGIDAAPPRAAELIMQSVVESILSAEAFFCLRDEPEYQKIRAEALRMKGEKP